MKNKKDKVVNQVSKVDPEYKNLPIILRYLWQHQQNVGNDGLS